MEPRLTSDTHLARVQALLDKAESTPYPAEAEAFMAKAQELMARHAIDEAMLADPGRRRDQIELQEIRIDAPYANAKAVLLGAVAHANRARVVKTNGADGQVRCTVIGYQADLANITTLFAALLVQAVRFMLGSPVPGHETPRRFRQSFLLAYATRIGERLRAADQTATAAAEADQAAHPEGRSVSLVLASRQAKVDRALRDAFPNSGRARVSGSSRAGFASGRAAADRAALNRPGLTGNQPGLPRG